MAAVCKRLESLGILVGQRPVCGNALKSPRHMIVQLLPEELQNPSCPLQIAGGRRLEGFVQMLPHSHSLILVLTPVVSKPIASAWAEEIRSGDLRGEAAVIWCLLGWADDRAWRQQARRSTDASAGVDRPPPRG